MADGPRSSASSGRCRPASTCRRRPRLASCSPAGSTTSTISAPDHRARVPPARPHAARAGPRQDSAPPPHRTAPRRRVGPKPWFVTGDDPPRPRRAPWRARPSRALGLYPDEPGGQRHRRSCAAVRSSLRRSPTPAPCSSPPPTTTSTSERSCASSSPRRPPRPGVRPPVERHRPACRHGVHLPLGRVRRWRHGGRGHEDPRRPSHRPRPRKTGGDT